MHADGTGSDILCAVAISNFMPQGLAATREHASRAVEMHHMTGLTLHDPAFNMLPTWPTGDEDSKSFSVLFFKKGLLSSFSATVFLSAGRPICLSMNPSRWALPHRV